MNYKEVLSTVAIVITIVVFLPLINSILNNKTKPHLFSWIIWGISTFVVALAQFSDHAGVGVFPILVSGIISIFVAILSYIKMNDHTITRSDWFVFMMSLCAIASWYFTLNPLWEVVLLTLADSLAFVPTLRKAWRYPYEENLTFYILMMFRNIVLILALENYSATTVLFPLVMMFMVVLLIALIMYRRSMTI